MCWRLALWLRFLARGPHAFVKFGADNVLAIRLDNPKESSRWYPGAGIYRNVWLVKNAPVHVSHWGTFISTPAVSEQAATVKIALNVDNDTDADATVTAKSEIFELKADGSKGKSVAARTMARIKIDANQSSLGEDQIVVKHRGSGASSDRSVTWQ